MEVKSAKKNVLMNKFAQLHRDIEHGKDKMQKVGSSFWRGKTDHHPHKMFPFCQDTVQDGSPMTTLNDCENTPRKQDKSPVTSASSKQAIVLGMCFVLLWVEKIGINLFRGTHYSLLLLFNSIFKLLFFVWKNVFLPHVSCPCDYISSSSGKLYLGDLS